ncbi:hypothetical protein BYT27DRAFT_7248926 [Phlegmacium glaucopus]|nr:hypothetical protein BYT27DRAFT_7248926 [Phlegmacium glaucopus]
MFFNITQLPSAHVSDTILDNTVKLDEDLQKDNQLFFWYLGLVEKPQSPETDIDNFSAFILCLLNYNDELEDCVICQRPELSFTMAGQNVNAKSGLCMRDENNYLLLIQEDKGPQNAAVSQSMYHPHQEK